MTGIVIGAMVRIIKFGVYLALTGCLVTCTMELKENAYKSVTGGLVNLRSVNKTLKVPGN